MSTADVTTDDFASGPLPPRPMGSHHHEAGPVNPDDLPWALFMEGVEVKVLRADRHANSTTMMVRFQPGAQLPRHRHMGPVDAWTFSGAWKYLEYDWVATAGTYVHEDSLGTHTFFTLEDNTEPTVVIFVMTGGQVLINDDGMAWWAEDAESMAMLYKTALANQGIELDDSLILR